MSLKCQFRFHEQKAAPPIKTSLTRGVVVSTLMLLVGIAVAHSQQVALTAMVWWMSRPVVHVGREWSALERVAIGDLSHQAWDELLRRYVDPDGLVDYASWKQSTEDVRRLDDYLSALSQADERREATSSQRLAFWITPSPHLPTIIPAAVAAWRSLDRSKPSHSRGSSLVHSANGRRLEPTPATKRRCVAARRESMIRSRRHTK